MTDDKNATNLPPAVAAGDPYLLSYMSAKGSAAGSGRRWGLLRRFVSDFIVQYWPRYLLAAATMALYSASVVALPWMLENLVNKVLVDRNAEAMPALITAIIIIFSVRAVTSFAQRYLLAMASLDLTVDLQRRTGRHILTLDLAFFQKNPVGQIIARIADDVAVLDRVASNMVITLVRDIVTMVGLVIYVAWTNPVWFGLALTAGPMIAVPAIIANRKLRRLAHRQRENWGETLTSYEECFHGIRGIKAENNESLEIKRLDHVIDQRWNVGMKAARTGALMTPVVDVVTCVALVGVILVGGREVIAGEVQAGTLMAFVAALMLLYEPLKRIVQLNALIQMCVASVQRIYEVLEMRPRIIDRPGAEPIAEPGGEIVFDDISFSYDDGHKVLDGFSAVVPKGTTVAFVGSSGSGKTTLFNLLARLYEVEGGSIRVGGEDIRDIAISSLRSSLALVTQDVLLFDASIRDNIAYGCPDAGEAAIVEAARLAAVDDFVRKLPEGYDFRVGPRGTRLSGGQRQRVAIARAILRDAPLLLLDEATSSLDVATEARVHQNVMNLRRGRTTAIIAHRLSTVMGADRIYFLEAGRIVESGTHEELMSRAGRYRSYVMEQVE
ncbi:MAG: ABC transporter ATP-binding protein [Hyphomicrobiales bacterium]